MVCVGVSSPAPFHCVKALRRGFSHPNQNHRWSLVFEKQKLWHHQTAVNTDWRRSYEVERYLEEVKVAAARGGGGGICIIKLNALVPREIINYACYADFREAAELQWKAMVEDIKHQQKQRKGLGNFKNCLAMCLLTDMLGNHRISALSLGLVMSEISEEPWKGMVITFGDSPYELLLLLHSIQGRGGPWGVRGVKPHRAPKI
ncbi:unnamed protein product [Prunus armeniaca]|uniref:Uncharacterized protein n=1 Tax=Prunus armeniaca TaxID=36596 RepID=A0A6J5VTB5_PRUAR|nr:unnamed protein product [Prunus armeniaca]